MAWNDYGLQWECVWLRGVGDIYKQTGGTGNFLPLGKHGEAGTMTTDASGNVYAAII